MDRMICDKALSGECTAALRATDDVTSSFRHCGPHDLTHLCMCQCVYSRHLGVVSERCVPVPENYMGEEDYGRAVLAGPAAGSDDAS